MVMGRVVDEAIRWPANLGGSAIGIVGIVKVW